MKKIYMILAAMTLLTLSLNAQDLKVDQYGNVVQPKAQTRNGNMKAPNRANRATVTVASSDFSDANGWTILDVNNDGSTWKISSGYATYSYNQSNAANDWLVYSAIALEAGKTYTFNLDAWRRSATWTEKLEVKFATGNTASALSAGTTIITETTISSTSQTSPDALSNTFTVPTSGNYYIGIHATSARNQYDMYVDNMVITTESTDPMINASTNAVSFTATPNETVNKTITVTGENLTGDITATISGTDASLFSVSPATTSGGTLTITYSPTAVGSHTATLTLSSTGAQDVTVTLNGTCSNDITICDGTATNNYLPIYGWYYDDVQINQMIYPASLLTNLNGKKITSMTFYSPNLYFSGGKFTVKVGETSQASFSSAVRNTADLTATVVTDMAAPTAGGTELTITFAAPFEYNGGNLLVDFEVTQTGSYGSSQTSFYGITQSGGGFNSYSSSGSSPNSNGVYGNATVRNFLPKVTFTSIVDTTPKIEVSPETLTINDSGTNNTFTVQGSNLGSDNVGVTVPNGSEFSTTTTDQSWGFIPNNGSVSGTVTVTYNGHALSATETVTATNNTGARAEVTVNYRADLYIVGDFGNGWDFSTGTPMTYNSGDNTYTATVTVDAENLILFARKLGESNPWNTRYVFGPNSSGDWWVNGDSANGTIDLYDDDPIYFVNAGTYTVTIDATTGALTIEKLVLPPPENVVATADSENQTATVTWDVPSNLPTHIAQVTEDFEDTSVFPPFTTGGVTATQHTGNFGEWTLYDATGGCVVYGSKQLDYDNEGAPHAWFVFKPSGATASSDYPNATAIDTHSGDQYLESLCPTSSTSAAGVSDHWLISPELSGNAQTISFYVCEMTTQYGDETYEIWVSTTDNDPSSFTQLGNYYSVSSTDWEERLVQLPEDTKYFAIRHTSPDVFGLLIDDITYETSVPIEPVSYNVYLDGVLVGNVDANDPLTYDFTNLAGGNYTVEISAVYEGDIESEKVPAQFSIVGKTPAPTISYVDNGDGTYTVTATGDGEVTLTVGGQTATGTGTASVIIVRSTEAQTVTATATAQDTDLLESDPATQSITIPALTTDPTQMLEGLLRLHLVIVDQMKEEIPDDNTHPDRYGYVLRYEPNGANDTTGMKESATVYVDIQKADCEAMGAYTLAEVDNDKHIGAYDANTGTIKHDQGIKMNVISADVEYHLSATNDLLYDYRLQGAENDIPEYNADYLSRLQKTQNFTYVEMEESNPDKGHEYPNGEHHYFIGEDNLKTGTYGSSYVSYAPSVSTWGVQRRYYEDDGYDNTYGAAITKTGAGYVEMTATPKAELQLGKDGSANWEYEGQACSLYILDNIVAKGKLPHSSVTTLKYEPYMFRVFVESKNGLLRHFQQVEGDGVNTGDHCEGIAGDPYGPICVWSGYVVDDDEELGQAFDEEIDGTETIYTFRKNKVDRTTTEWNQGETNAIFAAVDALAIDGYDQNGQPIEKESISNDDLNVFVRFYYIIEGSADDHDVQSGNDIVNGSRDGESSRPGNGAESPGKSPEPWTAVNEVVYNGEVVSRTYVNTLGMQSDQPFDGINIVVTRYSDGKISTTKVVH